MAFFYSVTPDRQPDVTLHYRRDDANSDAVVVGVQFAGGLISYISDTQAQAHIAAVLEAGDREVERVCQAWAAKAEIQIAKRAEFAPVTDEVAATIRAECEAARDEQLADYRRALDKIVLERRLKIGTADPALAPAVHATITGG